MPQEKISEFTFYDSIGTQINGALRNLNILEVLSSNWLGDIARLLGGGYLGEHDTRGVAMLCHRAKGSLPLCGVPSLLH